MTNGFTPSILNGGIDLPEVAPALGLGIAMGGVLEVYDIVRRARDGLAFNAFSPTSVAGDADFDPLNLATDLGVTDRYELQVAEILNGRLAMLAVAAYTMIEASGTRVVDARWWF